MIQVNAETYLELQLLFFLCLSKSLTFNTKNCMDKIKIILEILSKHINFLFETCFV